MVRSFKLLLAAVALLAVMCAGAAFAADPVEVDLKMGFGVFSTDQRGDILPQSTLPNNELRLWVTRRVGSIEESPQLIDSKGHGINKTLIMFATKPTADSTEGKWLSERVVHRELTPWTSLDGSGVIGSGIEYVVSGPSITLLANGNAVSGDKATIYVYGGRTDAGTLDEKTSVRARDDQGIVCDVTPFPTDAIEEADDTDSKNGGVVTSFDVVVLSSDAEIILDQIEADPLLGLAAGSNIVVKDAEGTVDEVVAGTAPQQPIVVELAINGSELVVVSSDGRDIDNEYTWNIDPKNARANLKDGDTTIYTFTPVIDPSGTITYRMDDPGLLLALAGRIGKELTISFDDLNTTLSMKLPACAVVFYHSIGGRSSSGICGAGAAAFVALAALAVIKRRSR